MSTVVSQTPRRAGPLRVADLMTVEVVTVRPDTPFKDVVQALEEHHISAVPVVDGGTVVGVVSEADLLPKEERLVRRFGPLLEGARHRRSRVKGEGTTAAEVMTSPVVGITPDESVGTAARLMQEHRVKRLPVIDGGRLVGIVSRADLLKVFLVDDAAIRRHVEDVIIGQWMMMEDADVHVSVASGVVTLTGQTDRRTDVDILGRFVAAMESVVHVDNQLTYRFDDTRRVPDDGGGRPFEP